MTDLTVYANILSTHTRKNMHHLVPVVFPELRDKSETKRSKFVNSRAEKKHQNRASECDLTSFPTQFQSFSRRPSQPMV